MDAPFASKQSGIPRCLVKVPDTVAINLRRDPLRLASAASSRFEGTLHVNFTGIITPFSFKKLHQQIRWAGESLVAEPVSVAVARIDRANTYEGWETCAHGTLAWSAPTALIVRPDQMASSRVYCALMAQSGMLRMAFHEHEAQMAQQWAQMVATLG